MTSKSNLKQNSIFLEILLTRFWARLIIVVLSLISAALGLAGPYYQKFFVDGLIGHVEFEFKNIVYAFLAVLFSAVFSLFATYIGNKESIIIQKRLSKKIYQKMLSLRIDALSNKTIGEVVSIYAVDIPGSTFFLEQTVPMGSSMIFPLILAPIFIHQNFDIPYLPLYGVILIIMLGSCILAYRQSVFFYKFKQLAAERTGLVNEWIQNIRTLRILGWIYYFENKIFIKREVETQNRLRMLTNGQAMNALSSSITFGLNILALYTLTQFTNRALTPGEILSLLWVLAIFLTRPFRQMPWFFTFVFDTITSMKRVQSFFDIKNTYPKYLAHSKNSTSTHEIELEIKELNLTINNNRLLKNINLTICKNEFIAIVGEVGSGKSLFLLSLLGETGFECLEYKIKNTNIEQIDKNDFKKYFSYVPQDSFIMSSTIRDNVAFEYDYTKAEDAKILESLKSAQLSANSSNTIQLDTLIGERGVNLSGGQRQRVNLARAHFNESEIILMDDCLSALDVDTEHKIINSLINDAWKDKTRILATHRLDILESADRVLFFKEGRIIEDGTYIDLLHKSDEFKDFTLSIQRDQNLNNKTNKDSNHA